MFHDLPAIHHHHTVRDARDHAKVMGDPDHGHAQLVAQLFHQFENLRLNGHIKRRCRLVRDQNLWITGQCDGDHDTLAHTAGKLVGVVIQASFGIRYADQFQQFLRALRGLALCSCPCACAGVP